MKYTKDIRQCVTNIQYYAAKIHELADKQLDNMPNETGLILEIAVPAIGRIDNAAQQIDAHSVHILSNLIEAERKPDIESNPEETT